MSPNEIINTVITVRDGTDPADTTNARRRIQAMHFLNHLIAFVHNYRPWSWTWTSATVTIDAATRSEGLPASFMEFGQAGGLYSTALKRKLREVSTLEMDMIRFTANGSNNFEFCVRGELIEIPFVVSSNLVLTAVYRVAPDIITSDTSSTAISIPDRYCRSVILPGLTRAMQQSKDDVRPDWAAELRDGLSLMCANDRPLQTSLQRWPIAIPGAW